MATERPRRAAAESSPREPSETRAHARPAVRRGGSGKLRLPARRPLREAVLRAFARSLAVARGHVRRAAADPVAGVHEYRKALRRARAVVALLAPSLGKSAARGLSARLQSAFRATNAFRDADILLQTLRSVPEAPEDDLARHAIEVALELEQRRTRAETAEALSRGVLSLRGLPAALDVVLDPRFSASDLERGLARSRRRAWRTLERARATGREEDLHEWRKRVKELRYQMELLASTGSAELKAREKLLGDLAQDLGSVTDLVVLRREIGRREKEGGVPPAPALSERIRRLCAERSGQILERGARLFEEEPRRFAEQVMAERG